MIARATHDMGRSPVGRDDEFSGVIHSASGKMFSL